ncbi:hypothetical protein SteCoe_37122 [Stentor coeruleus]|uniref:Tyrosine-protein kinase ephrin type A/B receptor-like domain-containing protein n=1 Tax=Stentor coeruleus TaxID=5963 RepID=A0A1R2ANX5_9CILI|nr:hypothetical protein SteCoe_37122 [Stentor coeruleus]
MIFLILNLCFGIQIQNLPSAGVSPSVYGHSMIYSSITQSAIIYGGVDLTGSKQEHVWDFSIESNKFTEILQLSSFIPYGRSGHCAFYSQSLNSMIIIGGETQIGIAHDVLVFSLSFFTWTSYNDIMPLPLANMACVTSSDMKTGFMFAGVTNGQMTDELYIIDLENINIKKIQTSGNKPSPRAHSAIYEIGNFLYIWGGKCTGDDQTWLFRIQTQNANWEIISYGNSNITQPRYMHNIIEHNNLLYILPGIPYSNTTYIFDIQTETWDVIENQVLANRSGYPVTNYNGVFYIHGGVNSSQIFNDLLVINLTYSFKVGILVKAYPAPSARIDLVLNSIAEDLIVFGGEDSDGSKLNDLWKYSTPTDEWMQLEASGTVPSKRSGMGNTRFGFSLYIFGGETINGYAQELFLLNLQDMSFIKIEAKTTPPSARKHPCICGYSPYIFIYGGLTHSGWSDELWLYNVATFSYTLISSASLMSPGPVHVNSCQADLINEDIVVMFLSTKKNSNYAYFYSMELVGWKPPLKIEGLEIVPSDIVARKVKNSEYLVTLYEKKEMMSDFYIYTVAFGEEKSNFTLIDVLQKYDINNSPLLMGSKLYLFGGIKMMSEYEYVTKSNRRLRQVSGFSFELCSEGFYLESNLCLPCQVGYYNDKLQSSQCTPCPAGTFNNYEGASSELMCLPCPGGTYSDIEGAYTCLQCPISYYCPAGSNNPTLTQKTTSNYTSEQPKYQLGRKSYAEYVSMTTLIAILVFVAFILILIFTISKFQGCIKNIDLFKSSHNNIMNTEMTIVKNNVGGVFTVFAYLAIVYFVVVLSTNFMVYNTTETKTLVPKLIQSDLEISGKLIVDVFLELYGGDCVDENENCAAGIGVENNLNVISSIEITCVKDDSGCRVNIYCDDCEIISKSTILLTFSEKKSYAAFITVNITADSSIPGLSSSVSNTISPDGENSVLRGINPNIIYYKALESYFEYTEKRSGYHIFSNKEIEKGSEVEFKNAFITNSVYLKLEIELSDSILVIQRIDKMSTLEFLMTIVSTGLGSLSMIRFLMDLFEVAYTSYETKKKELKKLKEISTYSQHLRKIIKDERLKKLHTLRPNQRRFTMTAGHLDNDYADSAFRESNINEIGDILG